MTYSLQYLEKGIDCWNQWRAEHPEAPCSLEGEDLSRGYYFEGNFRKVNLRGVSLRRACLIGADFRDADLTGADLSGAYLGDADFAGANLTDCNLSRTSLERTNFEQGQLQNAQIEDTVPDESRLQSIQLDECEFHEGPDQANTPDVQVNPDSQPLLPQPEKQAAEKLVASKQSSEKTTLKQLEEPISEVLMTEKLIAEKPVSEKHIGEEQRTEKISVESKVPENLSTQALSNESLSSQAANNESLVSQKSNNESLSNRKPTVEQPVEQPIVEQSDKQMGSQVSLAPTQHANELSSSSANLPTSASSLESTSTKSRSWFRSAAETEKERKLRQQQIRVSAIPTASAGKSRKTAGKNETQKWGRRHGDRTLSGQINYRLGQKSTWVTTAAAAGIALVVGVPFLNPLGLTPAPVTAQAQSLALAKSLSSSGSIQALATYSSPTGETWIVGGSSNGQIEIWDTQTGQTIRQIEGHSGGVSTLALSESGQWLVSGGGDGVRVWNPETGELMHETLSDAVVAVAISPDEKTVISSDRTGLLTAWDMEGGSTRYQVSTGSEVGSIAIAPDGQSFVTASSDRTLRQWDMSSGETMQIFQGHDDVVRSVAISPDGRMLVSGSDDQTIKLWDMASGGLETTLTGHSDRVVSLAISADSRTLASSSHDQTLKLWDLPSRQLTETLPQTETQLTVALAFDPAGAALVSGGEGQTVRVWQ